MHKSNKLAYANLMQFFMDLVFLVLSYLLTYLIISTFSYLNYIRYYTWITVVYAPIWLLTMASLGMYSKTTFNYFDRI